MTQVTDAKTFGSESQARAQMEGMSALMAWLRHAHEGDGDIAAKTVLSCFMVAMMPPEGINEAFDSLKSMLLFYSEPALPPSRLLGQRESGGTGRIGSTTRRPDLAIAE